MGFGKYFFKKFLCLAAVFHNRQICSYLFWFAIAKIIFICHNRAKEVRYVFGGESSTIS